MATIVQTVAVPLTLVKAATETTLTGTADAFTYIPNTGQILTLRNPTAGAITSVKLVGSGAGLVNVPGAEQKDFSTGFTVGTVGIGTTKVMQLDKIYNYLVGNCTVTSGAGLVAVLLDAS